MMKDDYLSCKQALQAGFHVVMLVGNAEVDRIKLAVKRARCQFCFWSLIQGSSQ
jgi:hypothetical protein